MATERTFKPKQTAQNSVVTYNLQIVILFEELNGALESKPAGLSTAVCVAANM